MCWLQQSHSHLLSVSDAFGQAGGADSWFKVSYRLENRWRDERYGKADPNAVVDTTELADKVSARVCT